MEAAGVQLYKNDEIWTKDGYRPDESLQWASRYGIPMEPVYPRIRQRVYEGVSPERPVIGRGTRVHNATETIGYIDHLLVDSDSGWITHLVVQRGLVPFRAIIPMELVKSISDESYVENVWRTYMEREFSVLINRFYRSAAHILVEADALVDKIIGDQAAGLFVPGIAGQDHARLAIQAAAAIMKESDHQQADGPWIPLGAGVHTGIAFVGSVGGEGSTSDITVLGDAPNTAARLSSQARVGEILISNEAWAAAQLPDSNLEERELALNGKEETVLVKVLADYSLPV